MKLISFKHDTKLKLGLLSDEKLYPLEILHPELPTSMMALLEEWELSFPIAAAFNIALNDGKIDNVTGIPVSEVVILAPVPNPPSCRDGYAFRQHVEAARRNRNVQMIAEFDEYPVFYFTNHRSIQGPGDIICMTDHFEKLDFELEVAIVVCKEGSNIPAEEADEYIGGLMIMNDMSARTLQMEEMLLNLGPAKGKDFSTVIGPWLVTLDELQSFEVPPKKGHIGKCWNLEMQCAVNGITLSMGNMADMNWTFAEIIERVSYGTTVYPGDIIGSGTVGSGCLLELNGTAKLKDQNYPEQWLKEGDIVTMEITGLGKLQNKIVKSKSNHSILLRKHK